MDKKIIIAFVVAIIVILGGIYYFTPARSTVGEGAPVSFATCLTDKGVKMYGAWWCPHCAHEKALFGSSFKKVTYVECATPDGKGQTQICKDKQITGYPTWVFGNGERVGGVLTLAQLSDATGCMLPNHTPNPANSLLNGTSTSGSNASSSIQGGEETVVTGSSSANTFGQ